MLGQAPDHGQLPVDPNLAVERAREMEDRLRIDGLAATLPAPQAASLRHRVRRVAAPLRHALEFPRTARPAPAPAGPLAPASGGGLRWTIGIAAPNDKMAARWGDWHFGSAVARALERRGHVGRVRTLEHESDPATNASDIRLVIRGLVPWPRRGRSRHVLWIISHPETVEASECDQADLVLVASEKFAVDLRTRTATPVEVLLQATDPVRFRPLPSTDRSAHPVVVVAKTRDTQRPIVTDAIAAGIRPMIYGTGWHGLVDPDFVVADYVANAGLASVYSSAGVVLNDHWPTMKQWDFVSNRLFDVLACGTPVISDPVPGIDDLFGDVVGQYHDRSELAALVEERLADPAEARRRVDRVRQVILTHHTFDRRVDTLLRLLAARGVLPGGWH